MGELRFAVAEQSAGQIHLLGSLSAVITESFASPDGEPSGMEFDGTNILSTDLSTDRMHRHDGTDGSSSTSSFASAGTRPTAVGWDGTNCLYSDNTTDRIYRQVGFSGTNESSLDVSTAIGDLPNGVTWDAQRGDLIAANKSEDVQRFNGFSAVENARISTNGFTATEECEHDPWTGDAFTTTTATRLIIRFVDFSSVARAAYQASGQYRGVTLLSRYTDAPARVTSVPIGISTGTYRRASTSA